MRRFAGWLAIVGTSVLVGASGCQPDNGQQAGATGSPTVATPSATVPGGTPPRTTPPVTATPSSPSSAPPSTPPESPPDVPSPTPSGAELLRRGDTGEAVETVQRRLRELGYWVGPVDGVFGELTEQAVYAVQKAAGGSRDGIVGPETREALDEGIRPSARSDEGRVVEVDLDRQLMMLVDDGTVEQIFSTSTGTWEYYTHDGERFLADTPRGRWEIGWQVDAWDPGPLGRLYRPKYFHSQGIAVHGYPEVPPYPASHGCVRVTIAAMDWLWRADQMPIGTTVWVY